jgi:hypothetical protein
MEASILQKIDKGLLKEGMDEILKAENLQNNRLNKLYKAMILELSGEIDTAYQILTNLDKLQFNKIELAIFHQILGILWIKKSDLQKAENHLLKSDKILAEYQDQLYWIARVKSGLASVAYYNANYTKAINYWLESLNI